MKKEFNLSKYIREHYPNDIPQDKVKEFIRRLKEKLKDKAQSDDVVEIRQVENWLDKLAGGL